MRGRAGLEVAQEVQGGVEDMVGEGEDVYEGKRVCRSVHVSGVQGGVR